MVVARPRLESWTISAAIAQLREMLGVASDPFSLEVLAATGCSTDNRLQSPIRQRGAQAAALMATLELNRLGDVTTTQTHPWGDVTLCPVSSAAE